MHTAGIVPSTHSNKYYGRALLYDFAGDPEYYSSHAGIFENFASSKTGININVIVVDLKGDDDSIESALHYWVSFVGYQKISTEVFHVIVGSHSDSLASLVVKEKKELLENFTNSMTNAECFIIDCRRPRNLNGFREHASKLTSLSVPCELSSEARLLLGLLEKDFSNTIACSLQTVLSHIRDCGVCLPGEAIGLYLTLSELRDIGVPLLPHFHVLCQCCPPPLHSSTFPRTPPVLPAPSPLQHLPMHSTSAARPSPLQHLPTHSTSAARPLSTPAPSHALHQCCPPPLHSVPYNYAYQLLSLTNPSCMLTIMYF